MKNLIKTMTFLLLMIANVQNSFAVDVWDGETIATGFYSGTGTKSNPYTIYTGSQFAYFYTQMANNGRTFQGQYIKIMNDIDMRKCNLPLLKSEATKNSNTIFRGDFDGNDHKLNLYCSSGAHNNDSYFLFGELYGNAHNIYFTSSLDFVQIYEGGEVYNCYFGSPWWMTIGNRGGTIANCVSGSTHYQNTSKYGGASGFSVGSGYCYNCDFDGCEFRSYGGSLAGNYGGSVRENNGRLTDEEHNQWVSAHSTSSKIYKTWPFTFTPTFPSYNVTITFVDNSGLTNYATKTITAGSSYTLPVPTGYESEFLGWECKGETVTNVSPTDNIVCTAKWNHKIKQQPTFLTPEISVSDKSYAKYQWKKTEAPTEYFEDPQSVSTFTTSVDNMVLVFDYSVKQYYSGGRYGDYYAGYVAINGNNLIYVGINDDKTYKGTMRYECPTAGEYKITKDGATLTNMYLECPATSLSGVTSVKLPYNFLTPNNGLYFCDIIYNNEIIRTDYLDTSNLIVQNGNIYYPTSETTVALLKSDTDAKTVTIPLAVTYEGVSYNVTAISDYAFADCVNLESVICMVPQPIAVKTSAFASVPSSLIIYVPSAKVNTYKAASVWKNYIIRAKDSYPAKLYNGNSSGLDVTVNLPNKPSEATASNFLCFINQVIRQTSEDNSIIPNIVFKVDNGDWVAKKIEITDAKIFYSPSDVFAENLTYTRNFTSTNWQALYLPFAMKYEEWKDKAEVAYINNVHQFDDNKDGKIERTLLEFITKTSGAIEANKPYVIKPKQTGEVTFTSENTTLYAAPETDGFVDCMSTTTKYTLFGTYQEKTDMYSGGYYGMNGGDFMRPSSASVTLPPFRAYLKIESRSGNGSLQAAPQKIKVMVDGVIDGEASGIDGLVSAECGVQGAEFNLNGQKVGQGYKGIVIRNGKKLILK